MDVELPEEVESEKTVDCGADHLEGGEVEDAAGHVVSDGGADTHRIVPHDANATGRLYAGTEAYGAGLIPEGKLFSQFVRHAGEGCAGVENEVEGTCAVDVDRNGEGGVIGTDQLKRNLAGVGVGRCIDPGWLTAHLAGEQESGDCR